MRVESGELSASELSRLDVAEKQVERAMAQARWVGSLAVGPVLGAALRMGNGRGYSVALICGALAVLLALFGGVTAGADVDLSEIAARAEVRAKWRTRLGAGATVSLALSIVGLLFGAVTESDL